jgi:uncharacterized protein YdhG (YjbR/CyaY superfamily)
MAASVDNYLTKLPADRRAALTAIRDTINANLPPGYEEGLQYGMISWFVPLSRYPDTYNKQPLCLASLGAQKNHMAMYLMTVYGSQETERWFKQAYADAGKKLDMGKSCVRFKKLEDVPLAVIGELIGKLEVDDYVAHAESARSSRPSTAKKSTPTKKASAKPVKKAPKKSAKHVKAKPSAKARPKKRR